MCHTAWDNSFHVKRHLASVLVWVREFETFAFWVKVLENRSRRLKVGEASGFGTGYKGHGVVAVKRGSEYQNIRKREKEKHQRSGREWERERERERESIRVRKRERRRDVLHTSMSLCCQPWLCYRHLSLLDCSLLTDEHCNWDLLWDYVEIPGHSHQVPSSRASALLKRYSGIFADNRPVHKASYILAIIHHSSVTMLQPINLRSISRVHGRAACYVHVRTYIFCAFHRSPSMPSLALMRPKQHPLHLYHNRSC